MNGEQHTPQRTETAREHIRNALALLFTIPDTATITLRELRAVEARLHRALEQIERGNP